MRDPLPAARTPERRTGRLGDLGIRAASALVMVALAVGTARQGGELFVVFWLAASIAVLWEWQTLLRGPAPRLRVWLGALALVLVAALARHADLFGAALVLAMGAAVLAVSAGPGLRLWAAGGLLYAGVLLIATLALRFSTPFGSRSIIWLFMTVWTTDTFAYFGGRLIGGPKLWPRISPSKTWSGTLAGLVGGTLIGTFAAVRDLPTQSAIVPILIVTLCASVFSQAGDAGESAIKRRFGVKDSSRLIPGHGGVMDRLDGFATAAAFALCIGLVRNLPSVAGGLFYWA